MVDVFRACKVDVACLGNHDLDFGVAQMEKLIEKTQPCPWLISNLFDKATNEPIGHLREHFCKEIRIKDSDKTLKVGFFGLMEFEWLCTLCPLVTEELEYREFVECAQKMSHLLREVHKCDLVVALTHMRVPNDRKLASLVPSVDFVLGGHDHSYVAEVDQKTGVFVIKSGTDFEEFSNIKIKLNAT